MKKYRVEITEPAESDLRGIAHYIGVELREPAVAHKLLKKISDAVVSLEEFLLCHKLVSDENFAKSGIRKVTMENYLIFYTVNEKVKTVTIVRILYGRRNWIDLI